MTEEEKFDFANLCFAKGIKYEQERILEILGGCPGWDQGGAHSNGACGCWWIQRITGQR